VFAFVALAAPFGLVAQAASGLVVPFGSSVVRTLLELTAPLRVPEAAPPVAESVESEAPVPELEPAELSHGAAKGSPRRNAPRSAAKQKPTALFVSQTTVLKLAESAARPRGSFVAQTQDHPAGLRLVGVGALGIGVQDGDILVEALGIAPRAPGEIIGAIIEARAKNARFLSGTLWRRGDTFRITVEQPYLPAKG
jgi:hypothetical protein